MSKRLIVVAFLCAGLTAACGGGGSGVSRSKSLASLSDAEITDLCEYFAEGEVREVDCGGGLTVTFGPDSVAECVTDQREITASCTATVADAEDCNDDLQAEIQDSTDAELCSDSTSLPASCLPLFECAFM